MKQKISRFSRISFKQQAGLTLLEVLIATFVMALIATMAFGALSVSDRSREVSEDRMKDIQRLDRAWLMLENDLRNALSYAGGDARGDLVPAMQVAYGDEFSLVFLRGGRANPLGFPRTELARVGYKLDEEQVLWRYVWIDPFNPDEDLARKQKIMENVEDLKIQALPARTAKGFKEGPWIEEWPPGPPNVFPLALDITLVLEDRGEITRIFTLAPGK